MHLHDIERRALSHFTRHDHVMARLHEYRVQSQSPRILPTPSQPGDYFTRLSEAIIGQQISTKAAASIRKNVYAMLGAITPETLLQTDTEVLRSCGLSGQKISYLQRNAALWHTIPFTTFTELSDETIITELTKLYGVGRWTAEMFCIFTLAREDVYSFGDLGLMQSLYHYYAYKPRYVRKIAATVTNWSPYRSQAALALWHARDTPFAVS
jgi:DNA-3-methyladenine glycosylase II